MNTENYLKGMEQFWTGESNQWNLQNKNPVVGNYWEHESFPDYDTVLFDGIETAGKIGLDFGCGPGRCIIRFRDRFKRIDGVDISEKNLENTKLHLGSIGLPVDMNLYKTNGKDLDMILDNVYDIVYSVICIRHINLYSARQRVFEEIFRVLKPGGWFTFQVGYGDRTKEVVDYYNEKENYSWGDWKNDDLERFKNDVMKYGFVNWKHEIRDVCQDNHLKWIWCKVQKPLD